MNINQSILLKAAAIGAGVGIVLNIVRNIPLLGICAICCLVPIVRLASGMIYGYFADQEGEAPDVGGWAVGGAIGGAAMALAGGIINVIARIIGTIFGVGVVGVSQLGQFTDEMGVPSDLAADLAVQTASGTAGIFGSIIAALGATVLWAVTGAIVGAIFAYVKQNQSPDMPEVEVAV